MVKNRYLRYCREAKRQEMSVEEFFHNHRVATLRKMQVKEGKEELE